MTTFTKEILSGRADGLPIQVTAIATPGTLIHTAHATSKDEIWLYAVNTSAADENLTIEFGGVAATDLIFVNVKKDKGLILVIPGSVLTNSLVVRAFASVGSVINILGWVNRIT